MELIHGPDGLIIDPTNPRQAITRHGDLAGRLYFMPKGDGTPPTMADLETATFIGFTDPRKSWNRP